MLAQRIPRLLLLSAGAIINAVSPAYAELRWNPFDHMTEAEAGWVIVLVGIIFLFAILGWPLLIGCVTYLVLKRTYPIASVRVGRVLCYACLAQWAAALLLRSPVGSFGGGIFYYTGALVQFAAPIAGAAFGYFQQRSKLTA